MRARHAHPDALSAQAKLTALNLPFMRENYQPLAHTAADKHWSHLNYFTELLNGEAAQREDRRVQRCIRQARFPVLKTIDSFDWNWPTKINRPQIQNLFHLDFVSKHANVVFISGVGLGKSHLMTALGYAACQRGHSVLFTGAIDIINTLATAHAAGGLKKALAAYVKPEGPVHRRVGLPAHRQVRRRLPVPDHQPPLRARRHAVDDEPDLQAMGQHLQRRRDADLGTAGPLAGPRRDRCDRGQELPRTGPRRSLKPGRRLKRQPASRQFRREPFSILKPAKTQPVRTGAHTPCQS